MELREFISETVTQIRAGINAAVKEAMQDQLGGVVAPGWGQPSKTSRPPQEVLFDVAVTATEASDHTGKGGIRVLEIGIGGEMTSRAERTHATRVQFSVPLIPPTTDIKEGDYYEG